MNEDQAAAADTSATTDNINSEEGGVSAAEVAEVLNLTAPETEAADENAKADESADSDSDDKSDAENTGDDAAASESGDAAKSDEAEVDKTEATDQAAEAPTFTIEIEDANGKKFTVGPDDNLEDILAEFEPKNNGQVLQLMRDLDKLSNQKSTYEADEQNKAAEAEQAEKVTTIQAGWDKEILKLQGEKRLPLDAKIADRKAEIFKFMADENDKRAEDGRPLLQSFEDALDKMELQEGKDAKIAAAKEEKELNKQRGGMVGGSSAPATSGVPAYKSGSARNANEALRAAGLL